MPRGHSSRWASAVVVGAITAIALTSDRLPERVASHFGPDGSANGFMARHIYLALMLAIGVGAPVLMSLMAGAFVHSFARFINIPNRAHWLAPARREATVAYLATHAAWLAAGLAVFVLAVHLLVIRANRLNPPRLDTREMIALLVAFAGSLVVWMAVLSRRFRRG
jgi:uncharacterized membrane protein